MVAVVRKFEWFVGWRYIRAGSGRSFISFISLVSMLGVALGVAVLIVVLSVMNGFEGELRNRILSLASHATITAGEHNLRDWPAIQALAAGNGAVAASAPFIEGQGLLLNGQELSGVLVRGVLPDEEPKVAELAGLGYGLAKLVPGEFGIVLGASLAESLNVGAGDKVLLMISKATVTPAGLLPRMRRFTVIDTFSVGMHEFDMGLAYIHMHDAAKLYRLGEEVSGLRLRMVDMDEAPQVVRDVARALGGGVYYVNDWTRTHSNFFRSIKITKTVLFVILLLVVGVAAFNIVSTLVMVVKEKQGDIAILRTMGSTPRSVLGIFMIQGTLIGLVGTAAGVALGLILSWNIEGIVHWLERVLGTQFLAPSVYFISDLPAKIDSGDVLTIAGTAFLLSMCSTLYPAFRGARTQPAEALRHE